MAATRYGLIVRLKSIATQLKNTGCDLDYYGGFKHGHNGLELVLMSRTVADLAKRLEEDE